MAQDNVSISAHKGTGSFILQRITALLLIPLIIWLLYGLVTHIGGDRAVVYAWLADMRTVLPMGALLLAMFAHMRIGMQEIIDDYIHTPDLRSMLSFLNSFFCVLVGGIAFWSLLSITFTA